MERETVNEVTITEFFDRTLAAIRFLLSKWMIIGLVTILSGLVGVLYAWLKRPIYVAEMSFVTDTESKGGFSAYAGLAAQFGIDLGAGSNTLFEGDNLIELLKSKRLIIQTLLTPAGTGNDNRLMIDYYLEKIKRDKTYGGKNIFAQPGMVTGRIKDSILLKACSDILKNKLEIDKRDKKLSIIDLTMKSPDENFSKRFSELLAQNAIAYYTDYKIKKSRQNVEILERQTDSVRRILYGNIGEVAMMNDLNVNPARQSLRAAPQRKQVEVQASGALYGELLKNLELSRLSLRKETPLIQIVDTPMLPLEKKGFGRLLGGLVFGAVGAMVCAAFLLLRRRVRRPIVVINP